ncbi:hypothetical protein NC653_010042 [Populus alba x Populus x berolinensis]|uniref:Translation initiation factor IF2/IF5 domain-containing protein n=1 Tax=Populus alba x Populus x berolinensis TaxID=444605 RepID=A0AAD6QZ76_9ROSI|nr:hypothetical protein NC653_010042 [Populus alba x Populus x berolinensis]
MVTKKSRAEEMASKQILSNMVDIAKALARPAFLTLQSILVVSLVPNPSLMRKLDLHLSMAPMKLQNLLGFLRTSNKKYVQCYGCGNPETEIIITKSQMLQTKMCLP